MCTEWLLLIFYAIFYYNWSDQEEAIKMLYILRSSNICETLAHITWLILGNQSDSRYMRPRIHDPFRMIVGNVVLKFWRVLHRFL